MEEINSFNELFACAKERGAYLDSFYQDSRGAFKAAWRAGPHIPGDRRGPHVERIHPFNAARDALLALLGAETDPPMTAWQKAGEPGFPFHHPGGPLPGTVNDKTTAPAAAVAEVEDLFG